jgi:hypothetical protein
MSTEALDTHDMLLARRAARRLALVDSTAPVEDVVVHADAVSAANLMREIVALHDFDAALEEENGHWRVVVRGGPVGGDVLSRVIGLVANAIDRGHLSAATLCVGKRTYTMAPLGHVGHSHEPRPPAAAA